MNDKFPLTLQFPYDRVIEKLGKRGERMTKKNKPITYPISEEAASTKKNSYEEEDHVFQRDYLPMEPVKKKKTSFFTKYKSLIISAVTAIAIGSGLGLFIMNMFLDLDPEAFEQHENSTNHTVATANEAVDQAEVRLQIPRLQGYVVQAGVFSTEENAKVFYDSHLSSFDLNYSLWEQEDKFYIFVHASGDEASSKEFHQSTLENNENFYAGKPWITEEFSLVLDQASSKWMEAFPKVFTNVLSTGNIEEWEKWLQEKPEKHHSNLKAFVEKANAVSKADDKQAQSVYLLESWRVLIEGK